MTFDPPRPRQKKAQMVFLCSFQDLTMETELEAVNGRRVRAIEVFAHALRFFREHALKVNATPPTPHPLPPRHDMSPSSSPRR